MSLVSIFFIRNQAKPISRLADAADAFGRGQDISSYKPSGAAEVRLAGQSFLKMRNRIKRHLEQRTTMLAGVSHDLRTPLTRLKLHLAMQSPSEDNDAAKQDLRDMESMLDGYLDFSRGLTGEVAEEVDIKIYLQGLVTKSNFREVRLLCANNVKFSIRPQSFERVIINLVSNALKYGDECLIKVHEDEQNVYVNVEDNGPGIPPGRREEAFGVFQRLDTARNQNIEGVGLGLSIARDITQLHGGNIRLDDSEMGGLKAIIRLPR